MGLRARSSRRSSLAVEPLIVLLDVSHLPAATVKQKLPGMYDQFQELAGVDITREPMEVGPTCHYFMGGIRVDAAEDVS